MALSLRITWVVGEMLGLASFPFAIDDIEIHLHGCADVLVPVLRYFHKKHALKETAQGTAGDQHLRLARAGGQLPLLHLQP